ncbi:MAG: restriction endonuclease subunit S [Opitutales bacterium]|nr:restriction endonuclease subunit S [Opitutales bacterium]
MRKGWTEVALGEVLGQVDRIEPVRPDGKYRLLGVRLEGRGAFHRETKLGTETSASLLNRVKEGDFIYSRLYAWKGAFALIEKSLDGCFVSNEFPLFRPVRLEQINLRYLRYWFKLPKVWKTVEEDCQGSTPTTRNRFNERFFLKLKIPLPPLAEQERIVARLDAIEQRLNRIRKLREEAEKELQALIRSCLNEEHCKGIRHVRMSELVEWRPLDTAAIESESYTFAGVYSFGRGVFRKEAKTGMDFAYDRLTQLKANEFTYPKLMAWEGALGVVPESCDGCYVSPEFPVFTIKTDKVLPEIVDIHFKTPTVWTELAHLSTGTNLRRRRLNPSAFLRYLFPLPPMAVQKRIAALSLRAREKAGLADQSSAQQQALLPSLLDRVFKNADT